MPGGTEHGARMREITFYDSPILFKIPDGKKFVKEVVYEGVFAHPNDPEKTLNITVERFKEWINNFKKKIPDMVYVPLNHSDRPEDNTGFVEDLFIGDSIEHPGKKGLFAKFNILLDEIASKIGRTILGCSIGAERYFSPETGEDIGEILSHIALTNEPYIQNLGQFKEVAFKRDANIEIQNYVFRRDTEKDEQEDKKMAIDEKEMLALKEKLLELERKAKEADDRAELAKREKELAEKKNVDLETINFEREITSEIDKLIVAKKILPAMKETHLDFARKLGKEKAMGYIKILGNGADVIDTTVQTNGADKDQQKVNAEKPKDSEIKAIWKSWIQGELSKAQCFERLKDWEKRFTLARGSVEDAFDESIKFKRVR